MRRFAALLFAALLSCASLAEASLVVSILDGAGQSAVSGQAFAKPITVLVTRDGVPLANRDVYFFNAFPNAASQGPRATFDDAISTTAHVMTDASGIARSPSLIAGAGWGTVTIVAGAPEDTGTVVAQASVTLRNTNAAGLTWEPLPRMWWGGASEAGWGISVSQHEERTFSVLYTYTPDGHPTWQILPSQWVRGFGTGLDGPSQFYTGAPYFRFDSTLVKGTADNAFDTQLSIPAASTGLLQKWSRLISPAPPSVSKAIEPFHFAPAIPRPERGVSDMWWGGPAQAGWGMSITEDRGNLFLVWFTYDENGQPTWFSMSDGMWIDPDTWQGPVYRTTGTAIGVGSPKIPFAATAGGDFSIRFSGTTAATFTYNVDGHAGTLNLQRFSF